MRQEAAELKALDHAADGPRAVSASPTSSRIPATAEALKPWYGVSCKRPCYHDDYLPAFNRDNVTLVDTDGKGVEAITERGLVVDGTEYPVDCHRLRHRLRLAGHLLHRSPRASTRSARMASPCPTRGHKGAWTLHGIWSHGFPNLCMNSHIQGGQHINIAYAAHQERRAHGLRHQPCAGRGRRRSSRTSMPRRVVPVLRRARSGRTRPTSPPARPAI